jgi:serine-type D-Ala-D-Ala carboxypeptidase (penicillin-binding protein 5/6)
MKKIFLLLLVLIPFKVNALDIETKAGASILMEYSTGKVLYENKAEDKMYPASMTKMMTLLLIMEKIDSGKIKLTDDVTISSNAASMGGSQVFLEANSKMKVNELIKSMAIASANDSAVAMAEYIAGTTDAFVNLMNKKAKQLGLINTNFTNVHGLDDANHYSCAKDMALIARELIKHNKILKYTSIYEEYLNKPNGTSTWMVNTNKLIKYYVGLDGLKTGFTSNAGYCLTSTALRNGMRLISVVMKEATPNDRSNDTINLLNYGFTNYKVKVVANNKKNLGKVNVINGKKEFVNIKLINDASNLENINEENKYNYNIKVNTIKAPVKVNDKIGYLELITNGKVINKFNLTVTENIPKASIGDLILRNLKKILIGN